MSVETLIDLQARVEIVNYLNASQNTNHYYIDLYCLHHIKVRNLATHTSEDEHIADDEIATEIYAHADRLGDLFKQHKAALGAIKRIKRKS